MNSPIVVPCLPKSCLLLLAIAVSPVQASIRYVDQNASGTSDGASWTNAFTNLQDALTAAQASDQIWVADGTYTPDVGQGQIAANRLSTFKLKSGVEIYGGFPPGGGDGTFTARAISSAGSATILSGDLLRNDQPGFVGNADNAYHVVTGIGADSAAILDGFTITAANGNGSTSSNLNRGGGITCHAPSTATPANPLIRRCHLVNNWANQGSAIYVRNSGPVIEDCHFSGNEAGNSGTLYAHTTIPGYAVSRCVFTDNSADSAGAIHNSNSVLTIANCRFEHNRSEFGGGIYISASQGITFTGCDFLHHEAEVFGGAIYNTSASVSNFVDCRFEGNSAESGSAIHCGLASTANLQSCSFKRNITRGYSSTVKCSTGDAIHANDCDFMENVSTEAGGGIYGIGSVLELTNCRFEGNSGPWGGAIYAAQGSQLTSVNCLFRGNHATLYYGGAVFASGTTGQFTNCAFSGNAADFGGALADYLSKLSVTNCSFQGNRASTDGGAIYTDTAEAISFTNGLIWENSAAGVVSTKSASLFVKDQPPIASNSFVENFSDNELNMTGSSNLNGTVSGVSPLALHMVNPSSAPIVSGDLRLAVASLGIDAGNNAANQEALDLAGAIRSQGTAIDLGAYEGAHAITFGTLFPDLAPSADTNGNGIDNFTDYATGRDPLVAESPTAISMDGLNPVIRQRRGASDVEVLYQNSRELDSWVTMIEGTDYTVLSTTMTGSQTRITITPVFGPGEDTKMFYRAAFFPIPAAGP